MFAAVKARQEDDECSQAIIDAGRDVTLTMAENLTSGTRDERQ
jgi:hypothetical protein